VHKYHEFLFFEQNYVWSFISNDISTC